MASMHGRGGAALRQVNRHARRSRRYTRLQTVAVPPSPGDDAAL